MTSRIKKLTWDVLNFLGVGGSVQLQMESALKQYGWFNSYHSKQSVDAGGNPIPWYTYPFISFLEPRIKPTFEVFEYGSGNSTRWYGAQVKNITAVEHDTKWIEQISSKLPGNAKLLTRALGEEYIEAVKFENKKYHIIVVDGRNRVKCTTYAINYLTDDGVLILDNSDRDWYQSAKDIMQVNNFRRLDLKGMTPIVGFECCTTVFYKEGNCLGI